MITGIGTSEWLRIVEEAAAEIATTALGFDGSNVGATGIGVSNAMLGPILPLGTAEIPMQMGLFADERGCQRLAKALLGMEGTDEDLPDSDLGDAVSEILNMLAGSVKRRISDHADVKLGLPVFVRGAVFSTHYSMLTAQLRLGPVHAVVLFALPEARTPHR